MSKQPNRWATLAVLAVAQFIVILDVTIINVALPSIHHDLHFHGDSLQWVISAYTLVFGGFLLLGGRAADLLGRRRIFIAGLLIFGVTSLLGGLATSPGALIALRAAQGLGAAMLSPAALSILTVTFAHGRERNIAMGVWGGLAGLGGTLGVVSGGVLVETLNWRWVFFVNVPIVVGIVLAAPIYVAESRANNARRTFDVAGAVLSTAGLLAIILGVIRAGSAGWSSVEVVALLAGGVVLLVVFGLVEARSTAPLVDLRLFNSRGFSVSTAALGLNGAAFLSMFFIMAVFLQEVRGLSPLQAGFEFLPMGVAATVGSVIASQLLTKIGTRPVQFGSALLSVAGLLWMAQAGASGSYAKDLLPGLILFGLSIVGIGVSAQVAAVAEVGHDNAGAASGVVTAGGQVGGALGLAIVSTLYSSHFADLITSGASSQQALVGAYHDALVLTGLYAAANAVLSLFAPALRPTPEMMSEAGAVA